MPDATLTPDFVQRQPPPLKRRVIKLGGSLLDLPQIATQLHSVISGWPPMANFVVVGGGQGANLIREWDETWRLGEQRSHHMAVFAMTWNAKKRFANHPDFVPVNHIGSLPDSGKFGVILAEPFLHSMTKLHDYAPLPKSWRITSDSIAADIAAVLHAEHLVLLKSVDCFEAVPPTTEAQQCSGPNSEPLDISHPDTLQSLANRQFVDVEFPQYASKIPNVTWCNFRRLSRASRRPALQD